MAERNEDPSAVETPLPSSMPGSLLPPSLPRSLLPSAASAVRTKRSATGLSALALVAFLGVLYLAHPVAMGLAVGTAMAFTSEPLYRALRGKLGHRRTLASILTTLTGGLAGFLLLAVVLWVAIGEIIDLVGDLRIPSGSEVLGERGRYLAERLHVRPEAVFERLNAALVAVSERAAGAVAGLLSTTTSLILTVIIAFFTMYYMLLEWPKLVRRLERSLPLEPRHTRALAAEFRSVGKSALVGTMGTSLVQGIFAAIGYSLAGIPQPLLWGTVTLLASFLPVVGTTIIWIPIGIVSIASGHVAAGVFTFVWGFFVTTGFADYVIRPRLVGSDGHVHPLPLLVSLLSGVELFGLMGLIVGPMLMSLCLAVLRIYALERGKDPPEPAGPTRSSAPPDDSG
jgi:predicted PurR-regulated permease PerM